jgi:hypothetical protein
MRWRRSPHRTVEHPAQHFRKLRGEVRGHRDGKTVPQRVQPGARDPEGELTVLGAELGRDLGQPRVGLVDAVIKVLGSGE